MTVQRGREFAGSVLPENFRVRTENLDLIPAVDRLAGLDWRDTGGLATALKVRVPETWPPPLVIDESSPNGEGWWEWYVVKREEDGPVLIGMVGVKGWARVSRSVQ